MFLFRSLDDLEKSGYPAESMLLEALLHTFQGKYFYFGFKLCGNYSSQSPTLKDVLKPVSDEGNTFSQLESDFENSHTLAYQILPNSASKQVTVTDHMRQAVHLLKHGYTPFKTVCTRKPPRSLSKSSSSRSATLCSFVNSYIDNSRQESVAFSFEESDLSPKCELKTHQKDSKGQETLCSYSRSNFNTFSNSPVLGSYIYPRGIPTSKNNFTDNQNHSYNLEREITNTFTGEIIRQLEYSAVESRVSNTSSRIDRELREREIKRDVGNLSRCLLLREQNRSYGQREKPALRSESLQNEDRKQSDMSDTIVSPNSVEAGKAEQNTAVSKSAEESSTWSQPGACFMSKDSVTPKTATHTCAHVKGNSYLLTVFMESQFTTDEKDRKQDIQYLKHLKKETRTGKEVVHHMYGTSERIGPDGYEFEESLAANDLILPDSEGLDTFFESQFSQEIMSRTVQDEIADVGTEVKPGSIGILEDSKLSQVPDVSLQKADSSPKHQPELFAINDLPESEVLEAFLSSFDDSVKDSGLYSDDTGTLAGKKGVLNESVKEESKSEQYQKGNVTIVEKYVGQADAFCLNPVHRSTSLSEFHLEKRKTGKFLKTSDISEKESEDDLTDNQLDCFLADIYEWTDDTEQKSKMYNISNLLATNGVANICPQADIDEHLQSKLIRQKDSDKGSYEGIPLNVDSSSLDKTDMSNNETLDLEEYLDRINTSHCSNPLKGKDSAIISHIDAHLIVERTSDFKTEQNDSDHQAVRQEKDEHTGTYSENQRGIKTFNKEKKNISSFVQDAKPYWGNTPNNSSICDNTEEDSFKNAGDTSLIKDIRYDICSDSRHDSSSDNNSIILSDDSFWAELCKNTDNLEHDCALISIDHENSASVNNSQCHCITFSDLDTNSNGTGSSNVLANGKYVEHKRNSCFNSSTLLSVPENTSFDLFEDSCDSQGIKLSMNSTENFVGVLVGDSDTDEITQSSPQTNNSIIVDSPNTIIDAESKCVQSSSNSLSVFYTSKIALKKENNADKNVKFHRQLRRVSSCQLMDIKMKLNGSPHRKAKVRRKSILKKRNNHEESEQKEPVSIDNIFNSRTPDLAVIEEKSHFVPTETQFQNEIISDDIICGSQDLFSDNEYASISGEKSVMEKTVHLSNIQTKNGFNNYMEAKRADTTASSEVELFSPQSKHEVTDISKDDINESQDLFIESPPLQPKQFFIACRYDKQPGDQTNGGLICSSGTNIRKSELNVPGNPLEHKNNNDLFNCERIEKIQNNLQLHPKTELKAVASVQESGKQNWLKSTLLNMTDTPKVLDKRESDSTQVSRFTKHLVIADSPDFNSCYNHKELNESHDEFINKKEDLKLSTVSVAQTKKVLNFNNCLENSPELFGDSPLLNAGNLGVSFQSKSTSKLNGVLLGKKLFS